MEQHSSLQPNDLLIFARVVDCGSFSRAADHLGLPRSTVSRRITQLEEQLGERLMLRTTRKLALTEFGHSLLHHAQQIVDEVDAAAALAEHRRSAPSGRLRVSMPGDFANVLLVDLLAAFSALHPAVTLDIDLSPRRVDLIGEHFDLALRMGDLPDDASMAARRLGEFPAGLYAAPAYLRDHGAPEHPEDLSAHATLCLAKPGGTPHPWQLRCAGAVREITPQARIAANSPELLIRLALAGSGITAVPEQYAALFVQRRELTRVLPHWCLPSTTCWAVFPERRLMPTKTRAFLDMLANAPGIDGSNPPSTPRGSLTDSTPTER
jgi:DNA-binding transcriptional LysR family regulator